MTKNLIFKNKYIRLGMYALTGAVIGYAYYYFVGCSNGCPLSSRWYITTGYGLLSGIVLALPPKKKNADTESNTA